MPTITEQIARWACDLKYEHLTPDAIEAAKRFLFDTVGCALGGYQVHDVKMFLEHYREFGQPGPCTVIGAGDRMNPVAAAMLNALMVRAMDYNDIYWKQDPAHPSDLISAPLAIAEWKKLTGKDLILAIVLGYDITMRLCHIAVPGIRERGWHHATLMAFAAPLVAGKLLGLTPEQMQHAIGIASCHCFTLGCAVAGKLTMMKNTVSPMSTRDGVEAALLAQRGYTGPEGVIEGKEGLEHCLGEAWDYSWITDKLPTSNCGTGVSPVRDTGATPVPQEGHGWMITQCGMKSYPIEALMHSPVSATLHILREQHLEAEDVKEVRIESIARAADILSDPAKYDPQSKESADHSLPYCIAAAVAEGRVTPLEFKEDKLWDARLRAQMQKVKVVANEEFERAFPAKQCTRVTITTNDGRQFTHALDVPKGDPRDPMTIDELEIKFNALAEPVMSEGRLSDLKSAIFDLEHLADAGNLMSLTVADL
ncbi:MAG: MmgE/PrpD family protein [Planctomycetes bacterium]|nr:MmgE/PrpD family protein [Planctomycetota bacterium]